MMLPEWFLLAVRERMNVLHLNIEQDAKISQLNEEEEIAFCSWMSEMDLTHNTKYMEWEDKHHMKQGIANEKMYLQGLKDGLQLAIALLTHPQGSVEEPPSDQN